MHSENILYDRLAALTDNPSTELVCYMDVLQLRRVGIVGLGHLIGSEPQAQDRKAGSGAKHMNPLVMDHPIPRPSQKATFWGEIISGKHVYMLRLAIKKPCREAA